MPDFKLKAPLVTQDVNIRDLLCHRIGFETFQGDFTYWGSTLSREDVILVAGEIIPKATSAKWYTMAIVMRA